MDTMDKKAEFEKPRRSRLAVMSLLLGMLSILLPIPAAYTLHPLVLAELLTIDLLWLLPFATLVIAILAFNRISKAKGLLKGKVCAGVGIFLSALPLLISPFIISSDINNYAKSQVATIDNVTKETTVLLPANKKGVWSLSIYISGYIDGSATISVINPFGHDENESEYKIQGGKVSIKRGGDWYSNPCLIKYEPTNVNSGHLKIRYYFGSVEDGF